MATTNITMRIDEELKSQAEELFNDLGLNMTAAFTVFVRQAVREQRIPFTISREIPNEETLEAFKEVEEMKKNPSLYKGYTDVDEMMEDLLKE
jgi:DNA-damage-inducible protein J